MALEKDPCKEYSDDDSVPTHGCKAHGLLTPSQVHCALDGAISAASSYRTHISLARVAILMRGGAGGEERPLTTKLTVCGRDHRIGFMFARITRTISVSGIRSKAVPSS